MVETPCEVPGCEQELGTPHYHCARCLNPKPTSMMGHYLNVDGKGWRYTCEDKDRDKTRDKNG